MKLKTPKLKRLAASVAALCPAATMAQYYGYYGQMVAPEPSAWTNPWAQAAMGFVCGAAVGAFLSPPLEPFRRFLLLSGFILGGAALVWVAPPFGSVFSFIGGAILAYKLLSPSKAEKKAAKHASRPTTFGSAEWATAEYIAKNELIGNDGIRLGFYRHAGQLLPLCYKGARHILTVAPTTTGKGATSIIPNLFNYQGSAVVIDPKGENAMITQARRGLGDDALGIPGMKQEVHIVDPWGVTGHLASCFNPMDWLQAGDDDISENAMILADAIVAPREHASADPFWDDEAKALLMGILLFVALAAEEDGRRNLGRVRDIIVSDDDTLKTILSRMYESSNPVVKSTAARTAAKDPKLRSNVFTSLQAHTHFLDSPRIRANLARSDFRFEDLKRKRMTVYLVLPADRLETFGRWLRLLIQQAITVNARNIKERPERPVLFLLDEMAALGRLSMVEQAYGLMAGFGIQLFGIVQDLSQLDRIYSKGWESFVGNSGVLQYFGSRDHKTAEYFSKLVGVTTIEKFSFTHAFSQFISHTRTMVVGPKPSDSYSSRSGQSQSESTTADVAQRSLAYPDELMVMKGAQQLLIVGNHNPIMGEKVPWLENDELKHLGINLREVQGLRGGSGFPG